MFSFFEEKFFYFFDFLKNYLAFGDFGFALILFAFLIKIILFPLEKIVQKNQKEIAEIQEEIKKIKKEYSQDLKLQQEKIVALFKEKKINPFLGTIPLFLQLPVFIFIYQLVKKEILINGSNYLFLGFLNLSSPYPPLAFLVSAVQLFFQKTSFSLEKNFFQSFTSYFFPILTFLILIQLPAGFLLYIFSNSTFSLIFQRFFKK